MCLAAFAINVSSRWPLVLASNRDEFFNRPALPLAKWQTAAGHTLFSGRDVQAGGTWLGMTPGGRLALLTNVREGTPTVFSRTRGELVVRWLESRDSAAAFTAAINGCLYGGCNLVLGDLQTRQWHCWSNRPTSESGGTLQTLNDGIYGLSNAALDTPWSKSMVLKSALAEALQAADFPTLETKLWQALGSTERIAASDLPSTGISSELEWALSSAHVSVPERNYGTRCASVLVLQAPAGNHRVASAHQSWSVSFKEITFSNPAQETSCSNAAVAADTAASLNAPVTEGILTARCTFTVPEN